MPDVRLARGKAELVLTPADASARLCSPGGALLGEAQQTALEALRATQRALLELDSGQCLRQRLWHLHAETLTLASLMRGLELESGCDPDSSDTALLLREVALLFGSGEVFRAPLELDIDAVCAPVAVSAAALQHALVALMLNAFEATADAAGSVRLCSREVTIQHDTLPVLALAPGEYVALSVADTGTGMEPATLRRAFDDGFSTKHDARGLGLGHVLRLVHEARGAVHVSTKRHWGSCFRLYLPTRGVAA